MQHQQQSLWLDVADYQLHVRQLTPLHRRQKAQVLMLHGALENGKIFYTETGKGLASYLADEGFQVFCADFAGRGLSKPRVSRHFNQSQQQAITQDIPTLITQLANDGPLHLIAHSWGGVLLVAALARQPELLRHVASLVTFGTKRSISVKGVQRFLQIDVLWNRVCPLLCAFCGYLPAKAMKIGADNEPWQHLKDTIGWIKGRPFVDATDAFDYAKASQALAWPPSWHFAGEQDRLLGHPQDVQAFLAETGLASGRYTLLSKANGFAADYDHLSMLTDKAALHDHFPKLAAWLRLQA